MYTQFEIEIVMSEPPNQRKYLTNYPIMPH